MLLQDLRRYVSGEAGIDLEVLRNNTSYYGEL